MICEVFMDEREVVCSKCENTTIIISDSVQSGWLFQEPGWALINYEYYCPRCNKRLQRNIKEINRRNRLYQTIKKEENNDE